MQGSGDDHRPWHRPRRSARQRLAWLFVFLGFLPGLGFAQDGRAVFEARCASCHAAERTAPPGAGPNLFALMGRRVGAEPGFGYSSVLEEAGRAGHVWDAGRLSRFLEDPEDEYPGVWMGANGLPDAGQREAVVRYLASLR